MAELDPPPGEALPEDIIAVGAVVSSDQFAAAVSRLRAAADVGWCDKSIPSPTSWPVLPQKLREWARWLLAYSRWAREHDRDTDAAVQDWLTVLKLARQVKRSRMPIALHESWALDGMVATEMMLSATETLGKIDTRALGLEIDRIHGPLLSPGELLEGERLWLHSMLEEFYVREGGDWLVVSEQASIWWRGRAGARASRVWNLASPLFDDLATARAAVDRFIGAADEFTDLIACRRAIQAPEAEFASVNLTALQGLAGHSVSTLARTTRAYYIRRRELDAAVAMLALSQYHRHVGQYPETLNTLVPQYLCRLPIDFADMQPMRYRRTEGDYLLYSIGADGQDNGGAGASGKELWRSDDGDADVVFSAVRRPGVLK